MAALTPYYDDGTITLYLGRSVPDPYVSSGTTLVAAKVADPAQASLFDDGEAA